MRIGIVNDLPMAVEVLKRALALAPQHQIVWIAQNGVEAVELCAKDAPDLVLMDLLMPEMDGVEATRRIMAETPCTILVVTVSVGLNSARVYDAMGYGALDAVDTPILESGNLRAAAAPLLTKIDRIGKLMGDKSHPQGNAQPAGVPVSSEHRLVVIGASAGGPSALATVLKGLPKTFPAAIVIVQHVDRQFAPGMAEWLNQSSKLPVELAREGDKPRAGTVLIASTDDHLVFKTPDRLGYTPNPQDYVYRPSVDVFFRSASRLWPGELLGVLLTGMGRDGASGLGELRAKGHFTIAQDKATSAVYGMPKAAAAIGAAVDILPLEQIAPKLIDAFSRKK